MIRTGRRPAWPVPRGRRSAAVVAVAMLLLMLGASALVSAGSGHHQSTVTVSVAAADEQAGVHPASGHEHRHGNDWVPSLGKRLRPASGVTTVCVMPACPARPDNPARGAAPAAGSVTSGADLILLGVLRV